MSLTLKLMELVSLVIFMNKETLKFIFCVKKDF